MDFVGSLHQVLEILSTTQDSTIIAQNTKLLSETFFKDQQCVPALLQIATASPAEAQIRPEVRVLASVEARKRLRKNWKLFDDETCKNIQQRLLSVVYVETNKKIRNSLAHLTAAIIRCDDAVAGQILPFLMQNCSSPNPEHRTLSMSILSFSIDGLAFKRFAMYPEILSIVFSGLRDIDNFECCVYSIKALSLIAENYGFDASIHEGLLREIPHVISTLRLSIQCNSVAFCRHTFELFDAITGSEIELPIGIYLTFLQVSCEIFTNRTISVELRLQAGNFIFLLPRYQSDSFTDPTLLDPVLSAIIDTILELPEVCSTSLVNTGQSIVDYDFDNCDGDTPSGLAIEIVSTFCSFLPANFCYPTVLKKITEFFQNPDPYRRRTACVLLHTVCEVCSDQITENIDFFINLLLSHMNDPDFGVRKQAFVALSPFAYFFDSELVNYQDLIMTSVFSSLNSGCSPLVEATASSLDFVIESFGENIQKYLSSLIEMFNHFLINNNSTSNLRCSIVSALGSTATTSGINFTPYFDHFLPGILEMTEIDSEEADLVKLRASAIEALAYMANAVGVEKFAPHFEKVASLALNRLDNSMPGICQCYYSLLGTLAQMFKNAYVPLLPHLIPKVFKAIEKPLFSDDDDYDEDDDEDSNKEHQHGTRKSSGLNTSQNNNKWGDMNCSDNHPADQNSSTLLQQRQIERDLNGRQNSSRLNNTESGETSTDCEEEEDLDDYFEDDEFIGSSVDGDNSLDVDDDDDDSSEDELEGFRGASALTEEKSAAIDLLAEIFESLQVDFMPYVVRSTELLVKELESCNGEIRKSSFTALSKICSTIFLIFCPVTAETPPDAATRQRSWVPKLPSSHELLVPQELAIAIEKIMPRLIAALENEFEPEVATDMCDTMQSSIRICGPCLLVPEGIFSKLIKITRSLLLRKHMCQNDFLVDDEAIASSSHPHGDDERSSKNPNRELTRDEALIVSSACDLVASISLAVGPEFAKCGRSLILNVCRYYRRKSSITEKVASLQAIAEMCEAMGHTVAESWGEKFAEIIMKGLSEKDPSILASAAFAVGNLAESSPKHLYIQQVILLLGKILTSKTGLCIDNACGALARIDIMAIDNGSFSENHVGEVLSSILANSPAKIDPEENVPIIKLLVKILLDSKCANIATYNLQQIVRVIAQVVVNSSQLNDYTRSQLLEFIRNLPPTNKDLSQQFNNAAMQLEQPLRDSFFAALA